MSSRIALASLGESVSKCAPMIAAIFRAAVSILSFLRAILIALNIKNYNRYDSSFAQFRLPRFAVMHS